MRRRRGVVGLALVVALGTAGCGETVSPLLTNVAIATMEKSRGDDQEATVATAVAEAPAIRAFDQNGDPMEGARVVFVVTAGGGSVARDTVVTDEDGRASAGEWVLGSEAGPNRLEVRAPDIDPVVFEATGLPGDPDEVLKVAGVGQSAEVGTAVAIPPAVRVVDAYGNGVPGVAVAFEVVGGLGSASGTESVTDSAGEASVGSWTLGTPVGEQALTARAAGLGEVVFTATATAGAPASMAKAAGDEQTAEVGTAVAVPPAVRVTDRYGNGVPDVVVVFAVTAGGADTGSGVSGAGAGGAAGSVTGAEVATDADGFAAVGSWTLGPVAGMNELTATVPGVDPVVFTAEGEPGPPTNLEAVRGDGQTAAAGVAVAVPPAVRVVDAYGNGVAGVTVTFEVTGGGGEASGTVSVTDAAGVAAVGGWTLGTVPGSNTLEAAAAGLDPVVFTATATAAAPATLVRAAGDEQTAQVGTTVPTPPSVRVIDRHGNGVPGVAVTFTVTGGGGSATGTETVTDGDGIATVGSWTLGPVAGTKWLTATVAGVDPITFTATAVPGPATALEKVRGDGQTAPAGSAVAVPPAVRVVDAFGNGVSDVAVTFAVAGGGGAATGTEVVTDAAGVAAVGGWTLGTVPGPNTLEASAAGLDATVFTATATAGAPAAIVKVAGDGQTAEVATAVATAPAVRVTDTYGNPVPGAAVAFAVTGGGGSVAVGEAVTDGNGVATAGEWTLGTAAGANELTATVTGVGPVAFTATGTAGAPASVAIQAGQGQTAAAGTAVAVDPAVLVQDAYGNPVAGVSVAFAVVTGGGTVTGSPASTDGAGVASVGWVLGDPGTNTLEASVPGLTPVTFEATAN